MIRVESFVDAFAQMMTSMPSSAVVGCFDFFLCPLWLVCKPFFGFLFPPLLLLGCKPFRFLAMMESRVMAPCT
jgi:hypothetical protein